MPGGYTRRRSSTIRGEYTPPGATGGHAAGDAETSEVKDADSAVAHGAADDAETSEVRLAWMPCGTAECPQPLLRQRSYHIDPVMSKLYPRMPLQDANQRPLHEYSYYVRLLTNEPWRVPVFYGRLPRIPTELSSPCERGMYGLFLMIVFREHRLVPQFVNSLWSGRTPPRNEDEAWGRVYEDFLAWRKEVDDRASSFRFVEGRDPSLVQEKPDIGSLLKTEPKFNTPDWWNCMISERLRNYDAAMQKHGTDMSSLPAEVAGLPLFHQTAETGIRAATEDGDGALLPDEEPAGDDLSTALFDCDDVRACDADAVDQRPPRSLIPSTAVYCGVLPSGCCLAEFHLPPTKLHSRNAEGRYWQGFVTQLQDASPGATLAHASRAEESPFSLSSQSALLALECQSSFFRHHADLSKVSTPRLRQKPQGTSPSSPCASGALPQNAFVLQQCRRQHAWQEYVFCVDMHKSESVSASTFKLAQNSEGFCIKTGLQEGERPSACRVAVPAIALWASLALPSRPCTRSGPCKSPTGRASAMCALEADRSPGTAATRVASVAPISSVPGSEGRRT